MALDLRLMRYAIAIAEEGTFHSAADRLHIAQPALSRQIHQLERDLGVQLFERRPTRPTGPGAVFVDHARRILADVEEMVSRTRLAACPAEGVVKVGYALDTTHEEMRKLLRTLTTDHSSLEVDGRWLSDADLLTALEAGDVDVAIGRCLPKRPGLAVTTLRREQLVAALPAAHRLARRPQVALRDLRGETFRFVPRHLAPDYFDAVVAILRKGGETFDVWQIPLPGLPDCGVGDLGGFTLVPPSAGQRLAASVTCVPLADPLPPVELRILWRHDGATAPVQRLVDVARELAVSEGWTAAA
jgi:DNA-binding transcriptional LysR family regulator